MTDLSALVAGFIPLPLKTSALRSFFILSLLLFDGEVIMNHLCSASLRDMANFAALVALLVSLLRASALLVGMLSLALDLVLYRARANHTCH